MPNSMCKCMTHPLPNLSPPRTDAGTVLSILGKYIRILGKYIWTGLGHDPKIALSAQILDTHSRIDIIISVVFAVTGVQVILGIMACHNLHIIWRPLAMRLS